MSRIAHWMLVGAFASCVPLPAQGQVLAARPIQWLSPLPESPVTGSRIPAVRQVSVPVLKGRFLVGVTMVRALTPAKDIRSHWRLAPFLRNTPRGTGWRPAIGLNWYSGDIAVPISGQQTTIGKIRVRPVMAGIARAMTWGRVRTTIGVVGGYAFTSAKVTAALPSGTMASIHISDAWVVRPNINLTYVLTRRLALFGSIGYVYMNPTVAVHISEHGKSPSRVTGSFRTDYVNVGLGTALSLW